VRLDPDTLPPVPAARPLTGGGAAASPAVLGADTIDAGTVLPAAGAYAGSPYAAAGGAPIPPASDAGEETYRAAPYTDPGYDDEPFAVLGADHLSETSEHGYGGTGYGDRGYGDTRETEVPQARRRLVVVGLPLLAVAVVIALAYWIGSSVLSVAGSVDDVEGSTPSAVTSAENSDEPAPPAAGAPIPVSAATVYDPFGDGDPDHPEDVPLSYDGDPATDWATYRYLGGTPDFGGLKPGVGVVYDLGSEQSLASVTIATTLPGSTVEIRTGTAPDGDIDSFAVAASGTVEGSTDLAFEQAVSTRYVLVWITSLVPVEDGFQADLAEVTIHAAG
jgi:hypothetical protein